jgi:MFS family permease
VAFPRGQGVLFTERADDQKPIRKNAEAAVPPRRAMPSLQAALRRITADLVESRSLIMRVFLPFVAGCYLAYLFRTINAVIAGPLMLELGLGAADLGLLTSVYFLTFAAAQIPIGVYLDRYGPRGVQSALLLVAAAGAVLFAASENFVSLLMGRALIGLGVAAAVTAGLKSLVLWFPKERLSLLNGLMMMLGALGAVTATSPAGLLLDLIGWRELFGCLAAATAGCAAMIYLVVPEAASVVAPLAGGSLGAGLRTICTDPRFWRLAPLSATSVGTAWALQGLWSAQWLTDVEGLDRAALVQRLFGMAVALSLGGLLFGVLADRLRRRGVGPELLFGAVTTVFFAAQFALILHGPIPSFFLWPIVAVFGAVTLLGYAILAEYYPKEMVGRATGALNVFHIGGAFLLQYLTGIVLQHWTPQAGHYPEIAYQAAFGLNLVLQILAWIWFALPRRALRPSTA